MKRINFAHRRRRGVVAVLVLLMLIPLLAAVAFAIDIGYIENVQTQLQRSADAAALAGAGCLVDDEALRGQASLADEVAQGSIQSTAYAGFNTAGGVTLTLASADLNIGFIADPYNPDAMIPSMSPNAMTVTLRRDATANSPISMFFGRVMGYDTQSVTATATAIFQAGITGFASPASSQQSSLLPYTLQVNDWNNAFTNGLDEFAVNTQTGQVTARPDGIREVKLFPLSGSGNGNSGVTPGNFGTIDLGSPSNSTSDLSRQILYGPNSNDFTYFPDNKIQLGPDGTLTLNGDTGISAGVKGDLASIIGKPRSIPLYRTVSGNGNNAQFVIVKFVGIRIVDVQLTGSLSSKHITVQPSYLTDPTTVSTGGQEGTTSNFILQPLRLIR